MILLERKMSNKMKSVYKIRIIALRKLKWRIIIIIIITKIVIIIMITINKMKTYKLKRIKCHDKKTNK